MQNSKYAVLAFLLLIMLSGCATKYIPVESVHTEYANTRDTVRDSVYHEVFNNTYTRGDTVFSEHIERIINNHYYSRDSVLIVHDSIPKPYQVEKKVYIEKERSFWQKMKDFFKNGIIFSIVVFIVFFVVRFMLNNSKVKVFFGIIWSFLKKILSL